MSHPRKKGGERKDKKTARMREAEEFKHGMEGPNKPQTDQHDLQSYKKGHESDHSAPQNLAKAKTQKKSFRAPGQ
jgi:hypothetical protein